MTAYKKEEFTFPSADGKTQAAGYFYTPADKETKAVLQISHGMCEYIARYEPMIEVLTEAGIAVCGNDHLGHGKSDNGVRGFFAEKNGDELVLEDLHTMNLLGHHKYQNIPYYLYGHSMGSFFARWYAEVYPDSIDGLVISGTGGPNPMMPVGRKLAATLCRLRGPKHVSDMMVSMSNGSYGKHFGEADPNCWLSRDKDVWEAYGADPDCGFPFTVSGYRDMLTVYCHVNRQEWADHLRKNMPIFIYSGAEDPVGDYSKGVEKVADLLRLAKIDDMEMIIYPDGRHEMHNELNKEEVLRNLIEWVLRHADAQTNE